MEHLSDIGPAGAAIITHDLGKNVPIWVVGVAGGKPMTGRT